MLTGLYIYIQYIFYTEITDFSDVIWDELCVMQKMSALWFAHAKLRGVDLFVKCELIFNIITH